uniref:Putative ovule protein n=1 Tax=Solanum chacoense TaxID=4108 RepID=A0A0V0HG59_SOLCH
MTKRKMLFAVEHLLSQTLDRYLVMGISRNSRFIHKYSPNNAITASPVTFTIHHVNEEGQPP